MSDFVYTLRSVAPAQITQLSELPPGDAITIQGEKDHGNIYFNVEPIKVPTDKLQAGLDRCLSVAKTILTKSTGLIESYRVETITLKLGLDAEVGLAFIGDAKLEAGIEIEIKRIDKTDKKPGD